MSQQDKNEQRVSVDRQHASEADAGVVIQQKPTPAVVSNTWYVTTGDHAHVQAAGNNASSGQQQSISQWQAQQRLLQRAKVASEVLPKLIRYLNALWSPIMSITLGTSSKSPQERFADFWQPVEDLHNEFLDVENQVKTFFGDAEVQLVDDIWRFKAQLWAKQNSSLFNRTMWLAGHGHHQADARAALERRAIAVFRPIATMNEA